MKKSSNLILPLVIVVLAVLAFSGWRLIGDKQGAAGTWSQIDGGVYTQPVSKAGLKYLVPPSEIYDSGLSGDDRPALTNPDMVDVLVADSKLADDLEGIAVTVGDEQRFYPFQILNWHEVVNTEVGGTSLVITYSPLTGSAVVYKDDRRFSDAGKVYNNGMLMNAENDATLWNQTTGQSIVGEAVGEYLEIYPSTVMSWAAWKTLYPSGLALSMETGYARDYGRHPYASYETSPAIYFPLNHTFAKVEPKDFVYRVDPINPIDQPVVFLSRYLPAQTNTNAVAGNVLGDGENAIQIVAFYDELTGAIKVFDRSAAEGVLTFERRGNGYVDEETGSKWSVAGLATSGSLKGQQLVELPVTRHYAFAHFAMFPNSIVSGEELLPTQEMQPEGGVIEIN